MLRAVQDNDYVRIEVEDEGVGIPSEDLERVFDPFFTTRSSGTGLGLSIAYQIVNQHGGHIAARKNPECGMTFTVTLPVAAASVETTLTRS
jgi:signal transduction histidine kinase